MENEEEEVMDSQCWKISQIPEKGKLQLGRDSRYKGKLGWVGIG